MAEHAAHLHNALMDKPSTHQISAHTIVAGMCLLPRNKLRVWRRAARRAGARARAG